MEKIIAIAGTFDSKAKEFQFIRDMIHQLGYKTLLIHTGVFPTQIPVDIDNTEVVACAGFDISQIATKKDRAMATEALSKGVEKLLPKLYNEGKFHGIISMGGSGGTSIVAPGMRLLPIGVPKVIVSTMASGNVEQYIGTSDIILMPSIVDVAGLNSISILIFTNAVCALIGMLTIKDQIATPSYEKKPTIAATMFGVTTPCIDIAKEYLENNGFNVLVFHATGTGGKAMENLIDGGFIDGVLDITTTEWCDEIVGGVLGAGPHRLEAASRKGIPQVVSVGAVDMVNFGPIDTIPKEFQGRNLYQHNPTVTLMRTTVEENRQIGDKIAEKLNLSHKNTALFLPLKGVSMIDVEGQAFYGKEEDEALFSILRKKIDKDKVTIYELDCNINDSEFALAAAQKLIDMINSSK